MSKDHTSPPQARATPNEVAKATETINSELTDKELEKATGGTALQSHMQTAMNSYNQATSAASNLLHNYANVSGQIIKKL
jgi:hypothetical protein